jgi:hypothetical protein
MRLAVVPWLWQAQRQVWASAELVILCELLATMSTRVLAPVLALPALVEHSAAMAVLLPVAPVACAIRIGPKVKTCLMFVSSSIVAPVVIGLAVKLAAAEEAG